MSQTNPFTALLAAQPFVLLDGAMATELEARGCDLADSLWSAKVLLENPQLIRDVHLDYFRAGAQVAITASYQATPAGFAARGLDEAQSRALIGKSVELARKAREAYLAENPQAGTLLVAGSVGPYGAFLADGSEYRGDYQRSAAEFQAFHRPRVEALLDAGADLLACETLPSFAEIQALAALLQEYPRARAWYSFTLRDAEHLSDGTPLREVMAALADNPQVVAVGINCIALENTPAALAHLHSLTALPLVVYPNSGDVQIGNIGSSPLAVAASQQVPIEVFLLASKLGNSEALVVKKSITKPEDLIGKRIAVPFISTTHYSLLSALKHWGIKPGQVQIINLQPPAIIAAWQRGDIDGAYVWAPAVNELEKEGKVLTDSSQVGEWGAPTLDVWVVRKDFAEQHPEIVKAFAKSAIDAQQPYIANPEAWLKQPDNISKLARLSGVPEADVPGLVKGNTYLTAAEQAQALNGPVNQAIVDTARFLKEQGKVPAAGTDYRQYVTDRFVK